MSKRTREIALIATFVALAVAIGWVEQIPNVEILSATVFLSGIMLGTLSGGITGALTAFLFSTFNPYGQASPPLLIAQIISLTICGMTGGMIRLANPSSVKSRIILGICGWLLTFVYDMLTTISFTLVVELDWSKFLATLAFGVWFYVLHILSNTLIFALLLPILMQRLSTLRIFANLRPAVK